MLNMDESQRHWVRCETRLKGFYTVHSLSYRNHLSSCHTEALRLATQGHQGTLWSVLYVTCGAGYRTTYIGKTQQIVHSKGGILCTLITLQ